MNEVRVRFPNESVYQHLTTPIPFDWEEFKVENIYSEVVLDGGVTLMFQFQKKTTIIDTLMGIKKQIK